MREKKKIQSKPDVMYFKFTSLAWGIQHPVHDSVFCIMYHRVTEHDVSASTSLILNCSPHAISSPQKIKVWVSGGPD